ncbi:MAG: hypothetical protein ACK521_00470, partial [bacterium]
LEEYCEFKSINLIKQINLKSIQMTELKGEFTTSPSLSSALVQETSPLTEPLEVKSLHGKSSSAQTP